MVDAATISICSEHKKRDREAHRSAETHDQYGHDRAELDNPEQPGGGGAIWTRSIHGDEAHNRTLI